jgi:hypothetical protein
VNRVLVIDNDDAMARALSINLRRRVRTSAFLGEQCRVGSDRSVGGARLIAWWCGYASAFPAYVIYPHRISEPDGEVAVPGHATGSHLRSVGRPTGETPPDVDRPSRGRQTRQLATRRGRARMSRAPRAPRLRLTSARAVTGIRHNRVRHRPAFEDTPTPPDRARQLPLLSLMQP